VSEYTDTDTISRIMDICIHSDDSTTRLQLVLQLSFSWIITIIIRSLKLHSYLCWFYDDCIQSYNCIFSMPIKKQRGLSHQKTFPSWSLTTYHRALFVQRWLILFTYQDQIFFCTIRLATRQIEHVLQSLKPVIAPWKLYGNMTKRKLLDHDKYALL
jgi:hypothetical protein